MPAPVQEFWSRLAESRLLEPAQLAEQRTLWDRLRSAGDVHAPARLAHWLIEQDSLTRYQAGILLAGETGPFDFGGYRVLDRLIAPDWAAVFRAEHQASGYPVALSFLTSTDLPTYSAWCELVQRVELAQPLVHPNLLRVWEVVDLSSYRFLVLDDLPGISLATALSAGRVTSVSQVWTILAQLGEAIAYLHAHDRSHGAINARRVWLRPHAAALVLLPQEARLAASATVEIDVAQLFQLAEHLVAQLDRGNDRESGANEARYPRLLAALQQARTRQERQRPQDLLMAWQAALQQGPQDPPARAAEDLAEARAALATAVRTRRERLRAAVRQPPTVSAWVARPQSLTAVAASAEPLPAVDAAPPSAVRRQARRTPLPLAIQSGLWAVLALALGAGAWHWANRPLPTSPAPAAPAGPDSTAAQQPTERMLLLGKGRETVVPDDGRTLWASPTSGGPLVTEFAPPQTRLLLSLRPSAIAAHAQAPLLRASLGPAGNELVRRVETVTGLGIETMAELLVCLHADPQGSLRPTLIVVPSSDSPQQLPPGGWTVQDPTSLQGHHVYRHQDWAYAAVQRAGHTVWIASSPADLETILAPTDRAPLQRGLADLVAESDRERLFTLVTTPPFLFGTRPVTAGPLAGPLQQLLGDDRYTAFALSLHLDDRCFLELRVASTVDRRPGEAASELEELLGGWPERARSAIQANPPHPHGGPLLRATPNMLQALTAQTRAGTAAGQAVLRAYLPVVAAHNFLMAMELAIVSSGEQQREREPQPTVRQQLAKRVDLRFSQEPLEFALRILGQLVDLEFRIQGADLETEGITRNQTLSLDLKQVPARQALVELLRVASPVSDEGGMPQLVYIVADEGPGSNVILITTRTAAAERGLRVPEEFRSPPADPQPDGTLEPDTRAP